MEILINASFIMSLIVEILINTSLLICYIKTFLPRDLKEAGTREVVFWNMFQRILIGKAHYPTQSYAIDENTLLISILESILIMWRFSEYWWTDKHIFSILKHRKNCECCPMSLLLSGNKECHEFGFSIVRIVISASTVTSL